MRKLLIKFSAITLLCTSTFPLYAARPIDLGQQNITFLRQFVSPTLAAKNESVSLQAINQDKDFNQTLHVRMNETYAGYPVWGGEAIIHIPNGTTNKNTVGLIAAAEKSASTLDGMVYQDLQNDLQNTPAYVFSAAQAQKALAQAISLYENKIKKKANIQKSQTQLMVYVDDENKAHWVFHVNFYVKSSTSRSSMPVFLMDATNFTVYEQWNEIKSLDAAEAGGFGGNLKMGKLIYDGLKDHLSKLNIQRDATKKLCYLQNNDVIVSDYRKGEENTALFSCEKTDNDHGNIYWDGSSDEINGGYSPNHDALYAGKIIKEMYQSWYNIPVLTKDNKPMILNMVTHSPNLDDEGNEDPDNAYWDPDKEKMFFGDGLEMFYPLTSLGVAAHEISHGFTEQHSKLVYTKQSGGMNEAFSDMAAQGAEYYSYNGKNSWQIGPEIVKIGDFALRYMDKPSKDCARQQGIPGESCSIDNMNIYNAYVKKHSKDSNAESRYPNVHYSSGIFNRAFYLLATSDGWNVRKAFDVMVKANRNYWITTSTFQAGACGVMKATRDYKYDAKAVTKAFKTVGINTSSC